ncbi:hypothetical protein AB4538_23850 [Vibrio lentus]
MSLSMSMDSTDDYLCDGVYWNWDSEQDLEPSSEDDLTSQDEIKMIEEVTFSESFSSSEAYRSHHFFGILTSNLPYMANRYCRYENLSKDYAEVAMQKNVLKDIAFVHATNLGINLTLKHIKKLDEIVMDIYNNTPRYSVYNRVGTLQHFLHECTLEQGKKIDCLDRDVMRKLLSLCRLHIAISDIRKKNIDLIMDELIKNNLDSNKNSLTPYVSKLNRQYITNWKQRHLRSLLHFCPLVERQILKGLINLKKPFNNAAVQYVLFKK